MTLYNGDANTNGVKDASEYSAVIPTFGANAAYLFYAPDNQFTSYFINIWKPLTNADAGTYYLRSRHFHDAVSTAEAFGEIEMTIVPDCSLETVTSVAVTSSPFLYTFNAAAVVSSLPSFSSSHALCAI